MGAIKSANPDSTLISVPSTSPSYAHGMGTRQTFIPMTFQVTSPFSKRRVLLPHALVMHVNPQNYSEQHTKKVERIQTRGGWVEQHWGDDLTEITCDGSTGAFMNINTGLSSLLRQQTIQWDRYRDLQDLYRNNGSLYDPYGNIVLQGNIMLMFDRGTYNGFFESFDVEETDDQPFAFHISFSFKVEEELMKIPNLGSGSAQRGQFSGSSSPGFQTNNAVPTLNPGTIVDPTTNLANINDAAFSQRLSQINTQIAGADPSTLNQQLAILNSTSTAQSLYASGDTTGAFQVLQTAQTSANQLKQAPNSTPTSRIPANGQ